MAGIVFQKSGNFFVFHRKSIVESISTTAPTPSTPTPWQVSEEVKMLKELIKWPEPQGTTYFISSTSPQNCDYRILNPRAKYSVGETLEVLLTARDHQKRPKSYGGDFFLAKLHSPKLKAGVTGSVKDHWNGTYTITFLLLWPGDAVVSIQLIHSSEAVSIIKRVRDTSPNKVYFYGYFQRNGAAETTECNMEIPQRPVCEYIDPGTGEKWVCVRPKQLSCSSLVYHSMGNYRRVTTTEEDGFLAGAVTNQKLQERVPAITVLAGKRSLGEPQPPICTPGLSTPNPSGFYYQDAWTSRICASKRFPDPSDISKCLRGKVVYMFGDSTLRQWWEYLLDVVPSLKQIDLHVSYKSGPLIAADTENNILIQWRGHGNPLRTEKTMVANLHYMANDIDAIGGGPDVVIAFTLWAHFTTFPVEWYIRRVRIIRQAVTDLLQRSPQTTVIIKSANTGYKTVYGSDWLSFQLDIILRRMFLGVPVAIVDAWQMTSCHYLLDNIHPGRVIIQNEVDLFLSHICPH
ncbi:NXPE family member 3 [Microcaecilia unicolor]|uniref:NXPE family member 3-like n=1 Tax=Microcaecilia unicolor TaxID=1415580 RepID=A0A6P7X1S8_9AMPH|nr:NXPE family member 3-like [Microcaecilia unicolor]